MNKIELLKTIGFSQEFIAKLEDYENSMIEISSTIEPAYEVKEYQTNDSDNIVIQKAVDNSNTNFIISMK